MYTDPKIQESIRKVEAARAENVKLSPARMSAEEKENLLKTFHPDYRENQFTTLRIGPNKGGKVPLELAALHSDPCAEHRPAECATTAYGSRQNCFELLDAL